MYALRRRHQWQYHKSKRKSKKRFKGHVLRLRRYYCTLVSYYCQRISELRGSSITASLHRCNWRATEWMPFQSHSSFTILFVVHTLQIARDCSAWLYFLPPRLWVSHITESLRQGIMASQTSDLCTPILYRGRRQRQQIPTESNWNMRGRIRVTQRVYLLHLAYGCLVL